MSLFDEDIIQNEEDISRFADSEKLWKMILEASIAIDERSKNSGHFLVYPPMGDPEKVFYIGCNCDTSSGSSDSSDEIKYEKTLNNQ